jgi:thiamine biosynthesis lipoprotein
VSSDTTGSVRKRTFAAMGTTVTITAEGRRFEEIADGLRRLFEDREARFSRFRPDSELSLVNARAGTWTRVSPDFLALLLLALEGAAESGGLFDPTVLPALTAAGYDRDFKHLSDSPRARDAASAPATRGSWRDVEIEGDRVRMPQLLMLDFGGIAKGWTVDAAAETAADALSWALVEAGGDLRLAGEPPAGGVDAGVESPFDPGSNFLVLWLSHGALATSSTTTRTWGPNLHHLIDPRTWRPAATGIVQATAWAPTCAEAEVRAKWALLAGSAAFDRVAATIVYDDGNIVTNLSEAPPVTTPHDRGAELPGST